MLWQKDANNIYVNFCQEDFEERTFERANLLLGCPISPTKSNSYSFKNRNIGNAFYLTQKWYEAIKAYNISLCFAENGTDHISLAYGNRSACFLQLKMYDKCIADIQLAIQAGFPDRLLAKLEARRATCLEQIESNGQSAADEPELSFEADDNLACMANVLQIQRNGEYGRHIIAKSDIGVGKVILMEQAFIPSISDKYKRCETCWKSDVNLIPCTKCTSVLFCPGRCEQNPTHEIQCGMRIIDDDSMNDQQVQLVRSILIAIHEFSSPDDLMNFVEAAIASDRKEIPASLSDTESRYRAFLKLSFDRKTIVKDVFPTQVCFVYKTLMKHRAIKSKFSSKKYRRFLMHLIGQHLCTIQCNTGALMFNNKSAFNISQVMTENLSILVNYINHSCAPNVTIMSIDDRNVCVTLRPIKQGDQLFVSYFRNDVMQHNTINRQQYLRDICDFHCKCERCVPSSTMDPSGLEKMKSDPCYQYVRKNTNAMNCCTRYGRNERVLVMCSCSKNKKRDAIKTVEKSTEFLNRYGHMPWTTELDFVVNCFEKALKDQIDE